jgi:hypothetical protein
MRRPIKQRNLRCKGGNQDAPRGQTHLRANVLIPKDSPILQIEIEVVAALLDNWESMESGAPQELSK